MEEQVCINCKESMTLVQINSNCDTIYAWVCGCDWKEFEEKADDSNVIYMKEED